MLRSLSPQEGRRMEIHRRAPSPTLCLISSAALIRKKKKRGKLFHLNFIATPLAVHPSKPLFVRRNLGILSEPLAWVSCWGASQSVWKGFQRQGGPLYHPSTGFVSRAYLDPGVKLATCSNWIASLHIPMINIVSGRLTGKAGMLLSFIAAWMVQY